MVTNILVYSILLLRKVFELQKLSIVYLFAEKRQGKVVKVALLTKAIVCYS